MATINVRRLDEDVVDRLKWCASLCEVIEIFDDSMASEFPAGATGPVSGASTTEDGPAYSSFTRTPGSKSA